MHGLSQIKAMNKAARKANTPRKQSINGEGLYHTITRVDLVYYADGDMIMSLWYKGAAPGGTNRLVAEEIYRPELSKRLLDVLDQPGEPIQHGEEIIVGVKVVFQTPKVVREGEVPEHIHNETRQLKRCRYDRYEYSR